MKVRSPRRWHLGIVAGGLTASIGINVLPAAAANSDPVAAFTGDGRPPADWPTIGGGDF